MAKQIIFSPPPPHIKSLSLTNYRGFRTLPRIEFAPLTFLVGPNSSGKSAISSAVLFLAQSRLYALNDSYDFAWTGNLVDLGSFNDVVYHHESSRNISIEVEYASLKDFLSKKTRSIPTFLQKFVFRSSSSDPIGRLLSLNVTEASSGTTLSFKFSARTYQITQLSIHENKVNVENISTDVLQPYRYQMALREKLERLLRDARKKGAISPETYRSFMSFVFAPGLYSFLGGAERVSSGRSAPERWYPAKPASRREGFGPIETRTLDHVDPNLLLEASPSHRDREGKAKETGATSLRAALNIINVADDVQVEKLSRYHSSIQLRDNVTSVVSNLADFGYGVAQAMPVILGVLGRSRLLVVEQPEVHLHPRAQAAVAELLCQTSLTRQVIVETHSEHMINAARLLVVGGKLAASNVQIIYVDRSNRGSNAINIGIRPNGDFTREWPFGFFDERFNDTMRLTALKAKRGG